MTEIITNPDETQKPHEMMYRALDAMSVLKDMLDLDNEQSVDKTRSTASEQDGEG